ncbi:FAD-binding domain-containing protein [Aurantiacibacter sediminis]|uniref:DNA photolyase n=1 Tax=Aurantiacibacter sediminis TaxID=2793064 RepID=A0ABS0N1P7_9SPHN|nr:FAD-binding domain-containing protein [Aurantiacibacter sediminis]MBH5321883.1 DNA photolyase [Aurantiacibacter sediminis]
MQFTPTREAGLTRLEAFLPNAGAYYERTRNHDHGLDRMNVSQLSPWLHAALLAEREVLERTLENHSRSNADKFVSEVFWRIYFKGYLEQRPTIWRAFCEKRGDALADLANNSGRAKAYAEATEGRTGIAAFDHWARELVETGYLHNHARMWFASIWIFTLKLDWVLGADFFLRHLMDGDAASNTLSWRWVGGLHTKGKTYQARADNIERYTSEHPDGPFAAEGISDEAEALEEEIEHKRQDLDLPDAKPGSPLDKRYALLLHDEAAHHVPLDLPHPPELVIGAARPDARSPEPIGDHARSFAQGAVESGVEEAAQAFDCPGRSWSEEGELNQILRDTGVTQISLGFLPTGWTKDALWPELQSLPDDISVKQSLPDLQRLTWPHARAGFFRVKKEIDDVLGEIGVAAG